MADIQNDERGPALADFLTVTMDLRDLFITSFASLVDRVMALGRCSWPLMDGINQSFSLSQSLQVSYFVLCVAILMICIYFAALRSFLFLMLLMKSLLANLPLSA